MNLGWKACTPFGPNTCAADSFLLPVTDVAQSYISSTFVLKCDESGDATGMWQPISGDGSTPSFSPCRTLLLSTWPGPR